MTRKFKRTGEPGTLSLAIQISLIVMLVGYFVFRLIEVFI